MSKLTLSGEIVIYKDGEPAITLTRETPIPISGNNVASIMAWCCADPDDEGFLGIEEGKE